MFKTRTVFAAVALAAAFANAHSAEFGQILADKSNLTFISKQMGVPVEGRFRKFNAALAFDPAKPAQANAKMDVDLSSIDAGSKDANDEVAGKSWFNVKLFPTASFVSTGVKPLGGDRYEVAGKLTIKGKSQDVVAPATFKQEGGNGVFDGGFVLKRLDFAIGEGPWSDVGTVANEVQIRFHLVAAPRK
ncbi:MAG: YceI family protein [Actinomycetota bacterium]